MLIRFDHGQHRPFLLAWISPYVQREVCGGGMRVNETYIDT
jgi:hypothetical protein